MRLTDAQMLTHWRIHRGLVNEHAQGSVEVFDNKDLTKRLHMEMRQWYLELLDNGSLRHLILNDIKNRISVSNVGKGIWHLKIPADVRRVVSVAIDGADTTVTFYDPAVDSYQHALNANQFSRSGMARPTAIINPDKSITLFCCSPQTPVLAYAMAVVDPGDEVYELDESALSILY